MAHSVSPSAARRWAPFALAALLAGSGTLHLVRPNVFRQLVPRALPAPGIVIAASGIAELVCAAGLATRQPWAGPASAALLIAVFPGNIQFAVDRTADPAAHPLVVTAAWLRLPLQAPLIWAALASRPQG